MTEKVTLINYTGLGHYDPLFAARVLAYTKNTRMSLTPDGLESFMNKPVDFILKEIDYMATTIPSSWEFVDLTFSIENISRATAQQITRTRTASFAMQSQRVTNMSDVTWGLKSGTNINEEKFSAFMEEALHNYAICLESGMSLEDARDLLPIGVHCNLLAKYNLRGLVELCRARDSLRVQESYRVVTMMMKAATLAVWPWAATFFEPPQDKAIKLIESVALDLRNAEGSQGAMYKGLSGTLAKAADLVKKS